MNQNTIYFLGRPDGIGNRIEQLIKIQEFCEKNNIKCVYIWQNSSYRNYVNKIEFKHIEIRDTITQEEKKYLKDKECMLRSSEYLVKYNFKFTINNNLEYDVIIHIRGGDRLSYTNTHKDVCTPEVLNSYIYKTIEYINNDSTISSYTIVTEIDMYKQYLKNNINKKYVELKYYNDIDKDWTDFYYLTKPTKYVIMCAHFSSFSICASILGQKKLMVFENSLNSNLPRYKADIDIIDKYI